MGKSYNFLELLLAVLQDTEVVVDALQRLLQLLVEVSHPLLALILQELLPEAAQVLDFLDGRVAPGLLLLNMVVEFLRKLTFKISCNRKPCGSVPR